MTDDSGWLDAQECLYQITSVIRRRLAVERDTFIGGLARRLTELEHLFAGEEWGWWRDGVLADAAARIDQRDERTIARLNIFQCMCNTGMVTSQKMRDRVLSDLFDRGEIPGP